MKHDAIITLGDFNAKLGKEHLYKDITGRQCLQEVTYNNGLRVVQYATINNFKVLSTWFPRKDIYKGTWKIPGTNDTNQIDHILVSKRQATDTENVQTYRGANSDSDHFLVGARLKQKISLMTAFPKLWSADHRCVVLGFCPCGPLRLNISPKKTKK
jgi:endonuclease/exonuclease/phosphatase family metal-dependent hydrolase